MSPDNVPAAARQSKMTKLIPIAVGIMAVAAAAYIAFLYYKKKKEEEEASSPGSSKASTSETVLSSVSKLSQSLPSAKELEAKLPKSLPSSKELEAKLPKSLPSAKELEAKLPNLSSVKEVQAKLPNVPSVKEAQAKLPDLRSVKEAQAKLPNLPSVKEVQAKLPSLSAVQGQGPSKPPAPTETSKPSQPAQDTSKASKAQSPSPASKPAPLSPSPKAQEQPKSPGTASSKAPKVEPGKFKTSAPTSPKPSAPVKGQPNSSPQDPAKSSPAVKDQPKTPAKPSLVGKDQPKTTQGTPKSPVVAKERPIMVFGTLNPPTKEPSKNQAKAGQDASKSSVPGKSSKTSAIQDLPKAQSAQDVLLQDPTKKYNLKLVDKMIISHDTRRFRFALPSPAHVLGLPVGQHVYLSATVDGKTVVRAYTPVSSTDEKGHMDLVVKIYFKNVNPDFPDGGKFSQYLETLQINDGVDVRGPTGSLRYLGNGQFEVQANKKQPPTEYRMRRVGMIAGGTGITPMYQLLQHVMKCPKDETVFSLVYANRLEDDILLRTELEDMAAKNPNRFKLWYTLSKPPNAGWQHGNGRVNTEMIKAHIPDPTDDIIVLLCGPDSMVNATCLPILKTLGFKNHFVY